MDIINKLKALFQEGSALIRLIYINVGVFILLRLLHLLLMLFQIDIGGLPLDTWLSLPASLDALLIRPWTLLTYMFLHDGFMHILFNMMWLFWFGKMFQNWYSGRQLVGLYIFGGLGGGILFMILYNLLPYFQNSLAGTTMVGASAAVMAIVFAVATTRPNDTIPLMFIGNIKLKHIAGFSILLDLLTVTASNPGGCIAHLGGAFIGFLFVRALQQNKVDITQWITNFSSLFHRRARPTKMKVKYRRPIMNDRQPDYQYNQEKRANQKQVDAILDKIKKSGYDSLTKQEKQILFDAK